MRTSRATPLVVLFRIGLSLCLALLALVASLEGAALADDSDRGTLPCTYDPSSTASCRPYACVPPPEMDENMIVAGTPGFCGKCTSDRMCGGAKCNTSTGLCARFEPSPRPEPVWPHFHLLVTNVTVNLADQGDAKPIVSAGYLFLGAFHKTHPQSFNGHGYLTTDLPRFYWSASGTVALAGPSQNAFVSAALTYYVPAAPIAITTLSLGAKYQRLGASVWKLGNSSENEDRLGPFASVGFLQNAFLDVGYVFPLRGPADHGAVLVGVSYMKDLLGNVLPDQFRKFLPAE